LFLAPQGDTPVRITHLRVGDSQCQFGGRWHAAYDARAKRAARRSAKREIRKRHAPPPPRRALGPGGPVDADS